MKCTASVTGSSVEPSPTASSVLRLSYDVRSIESKPFGYATGSGHEW